MDIQRSILIVALAVVSYLMVLQWNQDYGQGQLPTAQVQTQSSNVPADVPWNVQAGGDVPAAQQQAVAEHTQSANSTQLIEVSTDVLKLAIDPRGGDIVRLSLPAYPRSLDHPEVGYQLFDNGNERTYLAQSGLIGSVAPDKSTSRALWSSAHSSYQLVDGEQQLVVDLSYNEAGVNFTKRFTFKRGDYAIDVRYLIDNQSAQGWNGNLFAQIKRDGSPDPSSTTATGVSTFLGAAMWTADKPYKKISESDIKDAPLRQNVQGGWIAWLQHYFVAAWIADPQQNNAVSTRMDAQGNYIIGYTGAQLSLPVGAQGELSATLYAGPKIQKVLKILSPGLDLTVDYGILWFIAQPIFWLLQNIHNLLGNWGWSIIALTVLIKLAFFPLSAASYKSMAKMRAVAPKMQALKEQHGDDRQKLSQGMMELYKQEKINPLGGCLPILVQMPVFLALYWVLLEAVELRQAPWLWWIADLSIKDPLFILPILMGVSMFFQQQLNPTPPDPMQAKVMKLLPVIFTFFFLWFPAGLVLYWVVNNILSIAQQWYITRQIEAATAKS